MADTKISALPASTVPLAGTEVLPIVQSSSTKQVSVANLTAGRSFDALGMTLTSTDAGAAAAPLLELYRDSASPAASDTLGEIEFNGEDSAGNKQAYGLIHASILSPTSTAEQGQIHFETATAGALTEKMIIGTTNLVINEIGAVFNVRIEGDTDANLFYTDATNSRVGVGTVSPANKLDVSGTFGVSGIATFAAGAETTPSLTTSGDTNTGIFFPAADTLAFSTAGVESARFTSGGKLLVNSTDAGLPGDLMVYQATSATSVASLWNGDTSGDNVLLTFFTDGGAGRGSISFNRGAGLIAYNVTSDYRAKDIIGPVENSGTLIDSVPVYMGKMKGATQERPMFIAHEVPAYAHTGDKDAIGADGKPVFQQMDATALIPVMWAEIQSLRVRVAALES